jgi:AsmA-like C-terminal region
MIASREDRIGRGRFPRGPWWVIAVVAIAGIGLVGGGFWVHQRVVQLVLREIIPAWSEEYDSTVTVDRLTVWVFPSVHVIADGLLFRIHGRESASPLVRARRLTVTAGILGLVGQVRHLHLIELEGLELNVPPDRPRPESQPETVRSKFFADEIRADNSILRSLAKKPGDKPLEFQFHQVRLHGSGVHGDLRFHTELRNPKPPAEIKADGRFGPWDATEFGAMNVSGNFDFSGADLSVFHPVLGILDTKGEFNGTLGSMKVSGHAEIPDFEARKARHPIPFHADYRATVDGTTGDTRIEALDGEFLHSKIVAHGSVSGKGEKTISLDAEMDRGRLEDVLRFILHDAKPPFTGVAGFRWHFTAPLTGEDMVNTMRIEGTAGLGGVQPTHADTRQKLNALSAKGQGEPKAAGSINALSDLHGHLEVHDGVAHLRDVSFRTPGVLVTLNGTYQLLSEKLDLTGTARLEAELSETTTGVKSFFLKIVDPFFKRKKAGAVLPIRVTGTAHDPDVRTDVF